MTRTFYLFISAMLLCNNVNASGIQEILGECWKNNDHPRMSECVDKRAAMARDNLASLENSIADAIRKNNQDQEYAKVAQEAFEAGIKSFQIYRHDQCSFLFAVSSKGNGAADIQRACEAELDSLRAEQLKEAAWWLED